MRNGTVASSARHPFRVPDRSFILRADTALRPARERPKILLVSKRLAACGLASFLLPDRSEHPVLRAILISIVLTLAVGPNATLLCRTWCGPQTVASGGCHHDRATAPIISGDDSCDTVLLSATLLREGERRGVPSLDGGHAIPVFLSEVARSATDARRGHQPGREWSLDRRPLATILRI